MNVVRGSRVLVVVVMLVLVVMWEEALVFAVDSGSDVDQNAALCSKNLGGFLPLPYNNLPKLVCKPVWNSYVLRYSQGNDNVITIILSAIYTTGWVGIGFSKNGMMLNSSAMAGWITEKGTPVIRQYYLKGFTPSEVIPFKGELPLTEVPPFVAVYEARIYLAFQLKYPNPLKSQPILLAFSTKDPHHHHLTHHDDKTTIWFDFSQGNIKSMSVKPGSDINQAKKAHGILGLFGFGLILPYGTIIARYLRDKDPLWYYLHVIFQFVGFLLAVAAVTVGVSLYNSLNAHIPTHRGIGIFALFLSCLQVLAFFLRPSKDSKNRKYWNWYHSWVGRIALLFGNVNIILGIRIGAAGSDMKIGYGFVLGSVLLSYIVLEVLSKLRSSKAHKPQSFQANAL